MRKSLLAIALIFAASLAPTVLRADTVYNVNANIGGDILTGTISTDGNLGQLTAGDITAYSLSDSLNILGTTRTMSNSTFITPLSTVIDLYATSTQLTSQDNVTPFNFEAPGGTELIIEPLGVGISLIGNSSVTDSNLLTSNIVGTVTPASPPAVPELNPSSGTSALLLVACAAMILRGRRKIPAPLA
jgi:hypothetical protein